MKTKYNDLIAIALVVARPQRVAENKAAQSKADRTANALATYVAPGEKDEYYLFYSGGHSGQVFVAGIPSMRHIATIPVFAPYPATGYGFDEESKKMLGDYTWGDVHHPACRRPIEVRRPLAVRERQRQQPHRADRSARFQNAPDPRTDSELDRQPRFVVRHREQPNTSCRDAFLRAAAERARGRSERLREGIQRHGQRHQSRSARPAR